jgi:hypothetical protein
MARKKSFAGVAFSLAASARRRYKAGLQGNQGLGAAEAISPRKNVGV